MSDVDALIIGSGPGGLAAALALARQGELVLLLEQHYLPGGLSHSFPLGGHLRSPGVHYIGQLQPGGEVRRFYEGLGLDLVFCELNPDGFDHVLVGDRRHRHVAGRERNTLQLGRDFPADAAGIRTFYAALDDLAAGADTPLAARAAGLSLDRLLREHVHDPVARAVLSVQGINYGVPPSQTPAVLHAGMAHHYADGGWFPQGGGRALTGAFIRALHHEGGEIQTRTPVAAILTEPTATGRRVAGVRLDSGETITARRVVSNAGADITYSRLIGPDHLSPALRRRLAHTRWTRSCLSLFLTLELDPVAQRLDSGNYWLLDRADLEHGYSLGDDGFATADVSALFVAIPTLKDPTSVRDGLHALEAFTPVAYDPFAAWAGSDPEARPPEYLHLKAHLEGRMLAALGRLIPDVRARLRFCELGTPLTNIHYCRSTRGNIYGPERSLAQAGSGHFSVRGELEDLYLCGSSTLAHGLYGAALTGVHAAAHALGVAPDELLRAAGPPVRTVPADRPGDWPAELRARG